MELTTRQFKDLADLVVRLDAATQAQADAIADMQDAVEQLRQHLIEQMEENREG